MVEGKMVAGLRTRIARTWSLVAVLALACVMLCASIPAAAYAEGGAGTVTLDVIGVDDPASERLSGVIWVDEQEATFEAGASAWDVLKPALDSAGCTYDAQDSMYGVFVQSITSPKGHMLENTDAEPYSFWSFLVNGESAMEGVSSYKLQDGDKVELVYYAQGKAPAMPDASAEEKGSDKVDEGVSPMVLMAGGVVVAVVVAAVAVYATKARKDR